jgi:hypothetical protein
MGSDGPAEKEQETKLTYSVPVPFSDLWRSISPSEALVLIFLLVGACLWSAGYIFPFGKQLQTAAVNPSSYKITILWVENWEGELVLELKTYDCTNVSLNPGMNVFLGRGFTRRFSGAAVRPFQRVRLVPADVELGHFTDIQTGERYRWWVFSSPWWFIYVLFALASTIYVAWRFRRRRRAAGLFRNGNAVRPYTCCALVTTSAAAIKTAI